MSLLRDDTLVYVENPKETFLQLIHELKKVASLKVKMQKSSVPLYPINKQLDTDFFSKNTIFNSTKAEISINLPLYVLNLYGEKPPIFYSTKVKNGETKCT